jgi:hypothetical protein
MLVLRINLSYEAQSYSLLVLIYRYLLEGNLLTWPIRLRGPCVTYIEQCGMRKRSSVCPLVFPCQCNATSVPYPLMHHLGGGNISVHGGWINLEEVDGLFKSIILKIRL